jgi:hypothetical protein
MAFLGLLGQEAGQAEVCLAGIYYLDTSAYLGDMGVLDAGAELRRLGWAAGSTIHMADQYRETADMVLAWAQGQTSHCNIEIGDWLPDFNDYARFTELLDSLLNKLDVVPRERLSQWLSSHLRRVQRRWTDEARSVRLL